MSFAIQIKSCNFAPYFFQNGDYYVTQDPASCCIDGYEKPEKSWHRGIFNYINMPVHHPHTQFHAYRQTTNGRRMRTAPLTMSISQSYPNTNS